MSGSSGVDYRSNVLSEVATGLSLEDVAKLDSAVCSKLLRPQLLSLLARGVVFRNAPVGDGTRKRRPDKLSVAAVEWAAKREIKIQSYWNYHSDTPEMNGTVSKVFTKLENFCLIEEKYGRNTKDKVLFVWCVVSVLWKHSGSRSQTFSS